ncbi:alpha/beta-hydrolase [Pleomassaria siparia CBS 279.74]|uniref:Alpha/beta-hydrolase n=1 Tax=Pleomassaria siparia CBS 279.74 TaxID=1314801 RepID=A0A6G1KGA8_9PLEO|nr:alpha/beta-hydrolase [Pleomassaria siparia CBS 279.74]
MSQSAADSPGIVGLAALFTHIAFTALTRALTYPLRTHRAPALSSDVFFAVLRTILTHITIPQARYLNQTTTQRYHSFCTQQHIEPRTLAIEAKDGTRTVAAHWIGSPDMQTVILYFHGGGYTQPATEGYYKYFTRLVDDLNATAGTKRVAVLVLAYQLAPEATYPTQLQEAATILSYLLTETARSPADIFITGDSAGGGLSLSLLSHILYPHPDVLRIELSVPLAIMDVMVRGGTKSESQTAIEAWYKARLGI